MLLNLNFRDIWYFLYSATDRKFREEHMEDVLKVYHEEMSKYWRMESFSMSFQDFMAEMNELKLTSVAMLGMPIIYVMLNPDNDFIDTFAKMRRLQKSFKVNIGAPEVTEDMHPDWIEIRRRYEEIILELHDQGLLET